MSDTCTKCDECTKACPLITITKEDHIWKIYFGEDIDIWNCSSCFRCEASCPVDLSVRDALFEKRRMLKESEVPSKIQHYLKNIQNHGNVFKIDELVNEKRRSLDLEPIDFEKMKAELRKLLDETA